MRTPSNHRTAAALIVIAGLGVSAQAQFIGIELREDKSPPSAEGLMGFPGDDRVRIFNFYAMFAGPGAAPGQPGEENVVVNVGTGSTGLSRPGIGVNIERNPDASFYRAPLASGAPADGIGGIDQSFSGDNRREWSTFVSIGLKRFDSYYSDQSGLPSEDTTGATSDFGFLTQRAEPLDDRPPLQRSDWIREGWFNSSFISPQGYARDLGDGSYGVFLAQLAVMDLEEDADIGSGGVAEKDEFSFASSLSIWYGDVFVTGTSDSGVFVLDDSMTIFHRMRIYTPNPVGGVFSNAFSFQIPTPGALALFTLAGAAFARRRR